MRYLTRSEKSKRIIEVEVEHGQDITDLLFDLYVIDGLDKKDIATYLNVNRASVRSWLELCHIYHKRLEVE